MSEYKLSAKASRNKLYSGTQKHNARPAVAKRKPASRDEFFFAAGADFSNVAGLFSPIISIPQRA